MKNAWKKVRTGDKTRIEFCYEFAEGEAGESLRLRLTSEGIILDHVSGKGEVIGTCAGTAEELANDWCH